MNIIQQPDALSLSQNLRPFIIGSTETVSFALRKGTNTLLSHRYEPGDTGQVEVDVKDVIHAQLSYKLKQDGTTYEQDMLAADFTADINGSAVIFRVVRGGVDRLAETATDFLTQNWLTWQPTVKPVTYYTPEFLTYYAVQTCVVKLKAYFSETQTETITVATLEAGKAYTLPMQYAVVVGLLDGKMPGYYDVWTELTSGDRLSYIQRYQATAARSLFEEWVLFENSLGGLDTFRAYGANSQEAKHTHNIAEIGDEYSEYRVDTERLYSKNTGYLSTEEARWLIDFFPSLHKYIYTGSYLRSIVVTESKAEREIKQAPSAFTFTYKYADSRPLLNLPRTEQPTELLTIEIPELGNFTIPPRLAEVPRLPLSEGDLLPVQNPYSENWNTTTIGFLAEVVGQLLSAAAGTGGGIGHTHKNINLLNLLSYVQDYLLVNGKKIKAGEADLANLARRIETEDYDKGNTGVGVYQDDAGNWHIETDYLDVRLKFTATTVEIQKAYHIGGAQIKSAASMKCVRVEEMTDAYRCYMNTVDDDGNEVTNGFCVNDQAYVNTFNLVKQADGKAGNHFLWRLVTAVGTNYIDLSKTVCAEQSDAPLSGDEIVLLGYQGTDAPDRQVAVIDAGAGSDAPYYRQFVGINTFSLPAPETQLKPGNNELSGRFHIGQGSTGWENMDGLPEEIQKAADLASDAMEAADNAAELADGAAQVAADAQDRLDEWVSDGVISPTEKLTLKQELSNLQAEFEANIAEAQKYSVDTTAYTSAWEKYKSELEYHCADTPENIEVKETFATSQSAFYDSRTSLLKTIADKAKTYVDDVIGDIQVGGLNLLLNSGFTGDYKSENLQTGTQLTENKEMYSDALKHWTGNATVKDDTESASGRSVVLGSIEQAIAGMIIGEQYVLSYKAKGVSVTITCGNFSTTQDLTSSYKTYIYKFTFQGTPTFSISGTSATLCMPQLERGTVATGWNPSPQDNEKWLAEFQTLKYLTDAIKNGSVDILGGLILANMVLVGNYKDGILQKVTAGISGIYNDDDDVFAFGGGSLEQAIYTVMKYKENPMYQPTDEELVNMTKVVITHGGRAILNDVIVRGYIYALGGFFRGKVETFANGNRIVIDPTTNSLAMYDSSDTEVCKLCFRESSEYGSYPELTLTRKNKSGDIQSVSVYGTNVIARNEHSNGDFEQGVLTPLGIEFFRQNDSGTGQDTAAQYLATPAVRVISEATYIQSTDEFLRFTPTSGITAYMPSPAKYPGKTYYIKLTSGSVRFTGGPFLNSKDWQPSDAYDLTDTIAIIMKSDGMSWCVFYCG